MARAPKSGIQHLNWLLLVALLPLSVLAVPLRQTLPVQNGTIVQGELDDWLPGTFANTYVEGGALRLQPDQTSGEYLSQPFNTPFGVNAGVVRWNATVGADQSLTVDVRSSVDGQTWGEWRATQPVDPQAAQPVGQILVFPPFTSFLQYRVTLTAQTDSPLLDELTLFYINSTTGPGLADISGRVPLAGPPVLTPAPPAVARGEWAGPQPPATIERQQPQRVELAEVRAPVDDPNILATLRALRWVAQNVASQPDLPFHYLIDGQGNIFEGRGSVAQQIDGVEPGTIRIALLANVESEGVSEAAQARLVEVLAWLLDSYRIAPANVVAAPGAPPRLSATIDELRPVWERAIVRSQTLLAAGNTEAATERVALYNPGRDEARATLAALTADGEERRSVVVPAGQRVDVTLNGTLPITGALGLEVRSDRPILTERSAISGRELLTSSGADQPARAWYFGAGATRDGAQTTLAVINPQPQEVAATLTIYPEGTAPVTRTTTFAPRSRATLPLSEIAPDAERTIAYASGAAHLATGVRNLSRTWYFAEGSTETVTTTLHLLNPWPQQIAVTLQVMSEDGTSLSRRYALPAQSRFVLTLNDVVPALPFAMQVQAERPIAAERVMLFDDGAGATASTGAPSLATRWTFVEGSTAAATTQLLLIGNPGRTAVQLDVSYVLVDGAVERREYSVPATARLTIDANADVPDQPVVTTIITANRPVVAERSIYVDGVDGRGGETNLGIAGR
jgi:hypothetical protein